MGFLNQRAAATSNDTPFFSRPTKRWRSPCCNVIIFLKISSSLISRGYESTHLRYHQLIATSALRDDAVVLPR
jgi:hypothetical protein